MATSKKRIGDIASTLQAGDPIPGKPGHYYESGMFAPSPEHLASIKLQEAKEAGLLPIIDLDLYDSKGKFDQDKLAEFNFDQVLKRDFNIDYKHPELPLFSIVGFISTARHIDKELFWYFKIDALDWIPNVTNAIPGAEELAENSIIDHVDPNFLSRTLITGYAKTNKTYRFAIFQPFFVHLSTPILPGIQNVSTGLSVATISILKTIGYILYERLVLLDMEYLVKFLEVTGWKKYSSIPVFNRVDYYKAGEEVGLKKNSLWYRDPKKQLPSVSSSFSPKECFSESFAYFYVHREFLRIKTPELHGFMESLIKHVKDLVDIV